MSATSLVRNARVSRRVSAPTSMSDKHDDDAASQKAKKAAQRVKSKPAADTATKPS